MRTLPWIVLLLVGLAGLNTGLIERGPEIWRRLPLGPDWHVARWVASTFYLAAFLCTVAAVGGLANSFRRSRPHLPWVCPTCGYDLRATPHRCPECGTIRGS